MSPLHAVPPLREGQRVRVIAPAGALAPGVLDAGLARLAPLHLPLDVDPRSHDVDPRAPYLAGTDQARARALQDAFEDPQVGAILCARGGFGAMRALEHVNWAAVARNPKPLLGFSDITALHGALAAQAGMVSFHAPLLSTLGLHTSPADPDGLRALDGLRAALWGAPAWRYAAPHVAREGEARGPLLGGNLTLVAALARSPWFPDLRGALLFLEDVAEPAYKLDRLLTSLALRGVFEEVAGVIVGDLGPVGDRYVPAEDVEGAVVARVLELTAHRRLPVAFGAPWGHRAHNLALPFGVEGSLRCEGGGWTLDAGSAHEVSLGDRVPSRLGGLRRSANRR